MTPQTLSAPFAHFDGYCWQIALDAEAFPDFDDPSDPSRSIVTLSEDGVDLGPPHTAHQIIAQDGGGAFSHWNKYLYFSTTDGSDPNANGRKYAVRNDRGRYFARRAEQAVAIVQSYARQLPDGLAALRGKHVLEIGPGRDMGTVMLLAALGAEHVVAVDRFKGAWQHGWHEPFLDALTRSAQAAFGVDMSAATREAQANESFDGGRISFIDSAFEDVDAATQGGFDVTLSHSVFEHFYSTSRAARVLKAASNPAAVGAHHVDFRDHRNFGEPLEFLLVDDADYALPENNNDYGRGNRTRYDELVAELTAAGFKNLRCSPSSYTDDAYLDGFIPRLRKATSRFRAFDADRLRVLSAVMAYG